MNLQTIFSNVPAPIMAKVAESAEKERLRLAYAAKMDVHKADVNFDLTKKIAMRLSDEQKLQLAAALVDAADFDRPDLLAEIEGALSDALAVVRGEA